MVRIISISDEVYLELSKIKEGRSFTELLKDLLSECTAKGDAKNIIAFLNANGPLSEESKEKMTAALEKGRKSAERRKKI